MQNHPQLIKCEQINRRGTTEYVVRVMCFSEERKVNDQVSKRDEIRTKVRDIQALSSFAIRT